MRRKIKAPLTARAISLTINELERLRDQGFDPNACLDQSTQRGWRGVFPAGEQKRDSRLKPAYSADDLEFYREKFGPDWRPS